MTGNYLPTFCFKCGWRLTSKTIPLAYDPDNGNPLGEQIVRSCRNKECEKFNFKYERCTKGTGKLLPWS